MHLVVINFKKGGALYHVSLCIIGDDLEHGTCFGHELQRIVMLYIKENLLQIKGIDYFSDGCAGQYKMQLLLFLQQAMGNLPAKDLLALSNARSLCQFPETC